MFSQVFEWLLLLIPASAGRCCYCALALALSKFGQSSHGVVAWSSAGETGIKITKPLLPPSFNDPLPPSLPVCENSDSFQP